MTERRKLERAVVLAAGTGSRLVSGENFPKPLKRVAGVPLLVRILRTLQDEGIREAVVVTGYMGDRIRQALLSEPSLALSLIFVENEHYHKKNGVSLLAARRYITDNMLLTIADHLYSPEVIRRLRAFKMPRGCATLGVDFDIDRCFDLDDATKARIVEGRIVDIGKELVHYDAADVGVFKIGPELVSELGQQFDKHGDCSLSDGVKALASKGRFYACDVGDARWIDVDTPAAVERAEAMLRVFGDALGDEPAEAEGTLEPEALELFAPTWVRAAQPYREDHFEVAAGRKDIVRLMSNESPFAPSQRVVEAIVKAAMQGNIYPTSAKELRLKLGERNGYDQDHVVLGAGSTELIDLVIRTFVAPGEEVLLSVPTFSMYEARTRAVGGIPVLVPMTPESEFDVSALISAVTERTKVLFLCTPNNPTGNRIELASVRRLLRLGLPTVIDEAYFELGETPESLAYLLAECPNAIFLRTFSKAFGLAGMRLGYLIAHPVVTRLLQRVKVPWNISTLTIAAASAALEDMDEQQERLRLLRDGRRQLVSDLCALSNVDATPSEGNFVLVDVSRCGVSAASIADQMLGRGIMIRMLSVHHAERNLLRITVGTREQNARCVSTLRSVLGLEMGAVPWSLEKGESLTEAE